MTRAHNLLRGVRSRLAGEDGSESVELALLLPVALLLLAMIVIGSRVALANDRITGVAGSAARDASLSRSPAAAEQAAMESARDALADVDLHCTDISVSVDTSGFTVPIGTPATITVNVTCTVNLSDIAVGGLPGTRTLRDTATSPLDPARDTT